MDTIAKVVVLVLFGLFMFGGWLSLFCHLAGIW